MGVVIGNDCERQILVVIIRQQLVVGFDGLVNDRFLGVPQALVNSFHPLFDFVRRKTRGTVHRHLDVSFDGWQVSADHQTSVL